MGKTQATFQKRAREQKLAEKKSDKARRKAERAEATADREVEDGVDPDLVGIVAGPQPLPDTDDE
jgi:hypothetical protein